MTVAPRRFISWKRLHEAFGLGLVQVAGGFVGQEQEGRPTTARAMATRCCSPPESSAGRAVELAGQADPAEQLDDVDADLAFGAAGEAEREGDVVVGGEVRQEAEVLEHHADAAAERGQVGGGGRADGLARAG